VYVLGPDMVHTAANLTKYTQWEMSDHKCAEDQQLINFCDQVQ
jgi:hypothetical protein